MQTMERPIVVREESRPQQPPEPRRASAWDVLVTIVVCLCLWALLAAPLLERSAEAGPVGPRRSAALALLRPLVAISDELLLSRATGSVERALGRDPGAAPGGELILPAFELPPDEVGSRATHTAGTSGPATREAEAVARGVARGGPDLRVPTPSNKLRVAVIGDSLSQGLGPAIERWMNPSVVRVLSLGRQSTGLSREDYFNWEAGMRQIVEEFRPDLVFVLLGSNDAQAQISRDGTSIPVGSVRWLEGYGERAANLLGEATRAGTHVVWVGIPIVKERRHWDFYRRVNDIYRETASADPFGTYLDAWTPFEGRDGGYTAFVRNDRGDLVEVRASDGVHFTQTGYSFLARMAIVAADQAFGMPQKAVGFRV
jgi:lysophospholipase L1-like esterase